MNLAAPGPKPGSQSCGTAGDCQAVFSYLMFRDLERMQTVFTGIAAHSNTGVKLAYQGRTRSGDAALVSGSYFPVLGLQPAAGRLFTPDDDRKPGAHFVVVLANAYWRTSFDASPAVVGQTLIVNGHPMTILGVAPAGFTGTVLGEEPQVFVPLSMRDVMIPSLEGDRQPPELLGVPLRAAEAGRHHRAGACADLHREIGEVAEVD